MISQLTLEQVVALLGAVTGVAALTWNIVRYLLERPKIRIDAVVGRDQFAPKSQGYRSLVIRVFNTGRRPTVLIKWGARANYGQGVHDLDIPNNGFPVSLPVGGEPFRISEFDLSILKRELAEIYFLDIDGKEWKLPRMQLSHLISRADEVRDRLGDEK